MNSWVWIGAFAFAFFFIAWGRDSERVEASIARLPGGRYVLWGLHQIDLIISPRDARYEDHLRQVISEYPLEYRESLQALLDTRAAERTNPRHWAKFKKDGLVDHPTGGPGPVKSELREPVQRILRELASA